MTSATARISGARLLELGIAVAGLGFGAVLTIGFAGGPVVPAVPILAFGVGYGALLGWQVWRSSKRTWLVHVLWVGV